MADVANPEAVRLVIWDLDDTYWRGTLTEGGITEYVREHHDLVITLARRGIMNSICSKNNHDKVMEVLGREGIAEYFIFPSINWEPKGPRLARLIEDVQLRPATVLFIDDNHLNRAEAAAMVPGLQVADERFIREMLEDWRFKGKDDSGLARLKQYKLLEQKQRDEAAHTSSNEDFLRGCDIRVHIEHDVDKHIDRAVELINRTNQLNFTKVRVSEDADRARQEVRQLLGSANVQAGLVRVSDRYGDYGFVGFYVLTVHDHRLVHYCWSCRTLGMMVEYWLYLKLNRPHIAIVGEVLTELHAQRGPIDWIDMADGESTGADRPRLNTRVFVRGGCDLQSVAHFLALTSDHVVLEAPIARAGMPLRLEHSIFLKHATEGLTAEQKLAGRSIAYEPEDLTSAIADQEFDIYLLSFWSDFSALYRHKATGLVVPFTLPLFDNARDVIGADAALADAHCPAELRPFLENLRRDFESAPNKAADIQQRIAAIFDHLPRNSVKMILLAVEATPSGDTQFDYFAHLNEMIRDAAGRYDNVRFMELGEFIAEPAEFIDATHFNRLVYYRVYERVLDEMNRAALRAA